MGLPRKRFWLQWYIQTTIFWYHEKRKKIENEEGLVTLVVLLSIQRSTLQKKILQNERLLSLNCDFSDSAYEDFWNRNEKLPRKESGYAIFQSCEIRRKTVEANSSKRHLGYEKSRKDIREATQRRRWRYAAAWRAMAAAGICNEQLRRLRSLL